MEKDFQAFTNKEKHKPIWLLAIEMQPGAGGKYSAVQNRRGVYDRT